MAVAWLGDLVAGVLRGIGALVGELRKSKEAIAIMRLVAATVISAAIGYYAVIASGGGRLEAIGGAVGGAVLVILVSPTAARLGIAIPRWLAERMAGAMPQGGGEWEIRNADAVLGAYPVGLYITGTDVLVVRPKAPVQRLIVESYRGPIVVKAFEDVELRRRVWVTKLPGGGVETLNFPRMVRAVTFSSDENKWAHLVSVRAQGVDISQDIFRSAKIVFVSPPKTE